MKGKEAGWAQWCTSTLPALMNGGLEGGHKLTYCGHLCKKNLVDLYLGLVFCSTDLNVCSEACTKLLCPYSSCSTTWEHVWWYLQCCSSFSGSCWLSGIILHELFRFSISVKNIIGILSGTALSLLKIFTTLILCPSNFYSLQLPFSGFPSCFRFITRYFYLLFYEAVIHEIVFLISSLSFFIVR